MDEAFGHWLAGFTDGEGSFNILKNGKGARYCMFRIALHADELPILQEIQRQLGLGNVCLQNSPSQKGPRAMWTVNRKADCLRLISIFEQYPLRAKKRRDFEIWKQAVIDWEQNAYYGRHGRGIRGMKADWCVIDRLRNELCNGRTQRGRAVWT